MRKGLTAIALLGVATAVCAWWLLPRFVAALPAEVRVRLPEEVARLIITPLPTALPAPEGTRSVAVITIPATATAVPTATPRLSTLATAMPTAVDQSTPLPSPTAPPSPSPTPALPQRVLLDGLQITPQKLNNCGPTNLSIALAYHGVAVDQFDVAAVVKPHYEDRNVSPEELADYVNNHTALRANLYVGGNLTLLRQLIAAGLPVIVEKGFEPDWQGWMGHYLTLYGYDTTAATFTSLDTFLGPWDNSGRVDADAALDGYWNDFNRTFLVIYRPEEATMVAEIVGELADPAVMWQTAAAQAQTAIEQDAGDPFAWYSLGSSLYHRWQLEGDPALLASATAAFDQARLTGLPPRMLWYQFDLYAAYLAHGRVEDVLTLTQTILDGTGGPHVEETFLYRGHALLANGDAEGARRAYSRALELKPGFTAAAEALRALNP